MAKKAGKGVSKGRATAAGSVGPYAIVGKGGIAEVGDYGVAAAGLLADKDSPMSSAKAGKFGSAIAATQGIGHARVGPGGIASAGKSRGPELDQSSAEGGGGALAGVNDGGRATAGDGGVALARGPNATAAVGYWGTAQSNAQGCTATADFEGNALAQYGSANAAKYGLASIRRRGAATAGVGGVAIAWNHSTQAPKHIINPFPEATNRVPEDPHADPSLGLVAAGEGGLVIAFIEDANGNRVPVVGFIGEAGEVGPRVHVGLQPGVTYGLNARGEFGPIVAATRKKRAKRK